MEKSSGFCFSINIFLLISEVDAGVAKIGCHKLIKLNKCDQICEKGPYPAFRNARTSKKRISKMLCTILIKRGYFVEEEALLQQ